MQLGIGSVIDYGRVDVAPKQRDTFHGENPENIPNLASTFLHSRWVQDADGAVVQWAGHSAPRVSSE